MIVNDMMTMADRVDEGIYKIMSICKRSITGIYFGGSAYASFMNSAVCTTITSVVGSYYTLSKNQYYKGIPIYRLNTEANSIILTSIDNIYYLHDEGVQ